MKHVSRWKRGGTIWSSFSICDQSVCFLGPSLHPWRAHESQTAENGDQVQTEAGELCRQKFIIHDEFSHSSSSLQSLLSSQQWSLVCGTSERATAAGINLVRRSAWLQAKEYGATGPKISTCTAKAFTWDNRDLKQHCLCSSMILIWFCQAVEVSRIGLLFPFYSLCYICCPCAPLSKVTVVYLPPLKHILPSHNILCHRTRWWGNPSWSSSATRPPTSSSFSFSSSSHSGLRISLGIHQDYRGHYHYHWVSW